MKRSKKIYNILFALLISAAWILLVYFKLGICFETNDDRHIAEILAGTVTLAPEAHAIHINYLLGKILSSLYSLFPGIAWYGVFLIACHVAVWTFVLFEAWKRCGDWSGYLSMTIFVALLFLCSLRVLGNIQFTSTAALLAVCGYVCYMLEPEGKKKYILLAFFETMAYFLRYQSMLMALPIGMAALCAYIVFRETGGRKDKLREIAGIGAVLFAVVSGSFLINRCAYRSAEWREYENFNRARVDLFDYYSCPEYQDVKDILDKYGVSEVEYNAFADYVIIDCGIPAECLLEIAEFAGERADSGFSLKDFFRNVSLMYFECSDRINRVVLALYIAVTAFALLRKKYRLLPAVFGVAAGELFIRGCLVIGGRLPFRVIFSLYITEIFLLAALFMLLAGERVTRKTEGIVLCAVLLMIGGCCVLSGRSQYNYLKKQNASQKIMGQTLHELCDYCNARPQNRYIMGQKTFCFFSGDVLDAEVCRQRNFIVSGTWYSNSPTSNAFQEKYLENGWNDLYLIVFNMDVRLDEAAIDYLRMRTGCEPVEADRFTGASGGQYSVYYFGE